MLKLGHPCNICEQLNVAGRKTWKPAGAGVFLQKTESVMKKITLLDLEPNLKDAHLSNVILTPPDVHCELTKITTSVFENVIFYNFRFNEAIIRDVRLLNCMFINVYFEEVFFYDCELKNVVINDSFLTETYFIRGQMINLNLCHHSINGNSWNWIKYTKVESSIIDVDSDWNFLDVTFENSITIIDGQLTKY